MARFLLSSLRATLLETVFDEPKLSDVPEIVPEADRKPNLPSTWMDELAEDEDVEAEAAEL
jgi:hypothetical protein